eukprot:gene21045-6862_t
MSYIVRSTNDAGEDVLRMRNAGGGGDGADADDAFHRLYQAEVQEKGFEHSGLTEVVLPQPYSTARAGAVVFQVFQPGTSKPGCWEVGAVVHAGIAAAVVGVTKEEDEQNGDGGGGSSGSRRDPRCRDRAKCMVFGFEGGGCNVDSGALWANCIALDLGVEPQVLEEVLFDHHAKWSDSRYSESYSSTGINCFDYVIDFLNVLELGGNWSKLELSRICLTRAFADAECHAALESILRQAPSSTLVHSPSLFKCTLTSACRGTEIVVDSSKCAVCRDSDLWRQKWDTAIKQRSCSGSSGSGDGSCGGGGCGLLAPIHASDLACDSVEAWGDTPGVWE